MGDEMTGGYGLQRLQDEEIERLVTESLRRYQPEVKGDVR